MFILFNGWLALSTSYTAPLWLYNLSYTFIPGGTFVKSITFVQVDYFKSSPIVVI